MTPVIINTQNYWKCRSLLSLCCDFMIRMLKSCSISFRGWSQRRRQNALERWILTWISLLIKIAWHQKPSRFTRIRFTVSSTGWQQRWTMLMPVSDDVACFRDAPICNTRTRVHNGGLCTRGLRSTGNKLTSCFFYFRSLSGQMLCAEQKAPAGGRNSG